MFLIPIMAFISRCHGASWCKFPVTWLFALPFAAVTYLHTNSPLVTIFAYIVSYLGMTQGVGNFNTNANVSSVGTIKFANPLNGTSVKTFQYELSTYPGNGGGAGGIFIKGVGAWTGGQGALNNIKFTPASGTMGGNFHLYGIQGK